MASQQRKSVGAEINYAVRLDSMGDADKFVDELAGMYMQCHEVFAAVRSLFCEVFVAGFPDDEAGYEKCLHFACRRTC